MKQLAADFLLRAKRLDPAFMLAVLCLIVVGVCFIFSAGYHMGYSQWVRQIIWTCAGLCVFFTVVHYDFKKLRDASFIIYGGVLTLLLLLPVFGTLVNGSRRWFDLGLLNLQPSELMKPALVLALATYLSEPMRNVRRASTLFSALGLAAVPFLLIASQPDFGTAMVIVPITVAMLFTAGMAWRVLGLFIAAGAASMPLIWLVLKPHQQDRIRVFLDPSVDPTGAGWNVIQSKIAVASGGLNGKGFLEGTQNILGFLPKTVAPTDFIYSVISEEMGFIGSAGLVGLYGILLFSITRTALRTKDSFGRLVAIGILAMLYAHVTVNVAMTVGLMPITGLPLPLVSYGGSQMISVMLALGLVQSVHVRRT